MRAYRLHLGEEALVYRLAYNGDVVAFKMGRRRDPAWPISTRFRNVWHGRDAPETIDDQRRCTGCRYRTIYGGSRGSASLPAPAKWLGPITPTVYINNSTLTETKVFVSVLFYLERFLDRSS